MGWNRVSHHSSFGLVNRGQGHKTVTWLCVEINRTSARWTILLWGESIGHRWIPFTKGQWCRNVMFPLLSAVEQTVEWPAVWDAMTLMWRHANGQFGKRIIVTMNNCVNGQLGASLIIWTKQVLRYKFLAYIALRIIRLIPENTYIRTICCHYTSPPALTWYTYKLLNTHHHTYIAFSNIPRDSCRYERICWRNVVYSFHLTMSMAES